jgi:peptidyl-prolyl cis-trans isomerase B (cyclophilin B)
MEPPPLPTSVSTFDPQQSPTATEGTLQHAVIRTTCGDIEVELYGDKAPVTVASFAFLAGEGYWEDSPCHRLTTAGIFVLQCGDPTGTGRGGPGYTFGIENAPPDGHYPRGTLAMARAADPNSNGGQFFVVFEDTRLPVEGGGYTSFGRVTSGMDIIDQIAEQGVDGGGADGMPVQPISILEVEITEEKASDT